MAHEAAQELIAHRARRTLGDRAEQVVAAEPPGAEVVDTSPIVPPLSGHAGSAALMRLTTAATMLSYAALEPPVEPRA